jgi:molybdopterin-guanine dinucleotide biosynthesis protein A
MAEGASRAGFVLVGGESSRMGRDKALLEFQGSTLVARIAECVRSVTGNVTLVGSPERYRDLGYTVIADRVPGQGPLGGVHTALQSTRAEWNLIVACDMPFVTAALFEDLFAAAESGPSTADCIIPSHGEGTRLDPLCAVYQRRCAVAARRAIDRNIFKMHDFVSTLRLRKHTVADPAPLANINTPSEWSGV